MKKKDFNIFAKKDKEPKVKETKFIVTDQNLIPFYPGSIRRERITPTQFKMIFFYQNQEDIIFRVTKPDKFRLLYNELSNETFGREIDCEEKYPEFEFMDTSKVYVEANYQMKCYLITQYIQEGK